MQFEPQVIRRSAERFDVRVFQEKLLAFMAEKTGAPAAGPSVGASK